MGAMTAAMVGMGAISAGMQMAGGMQEQREAESNASAIQSQAAYNAGVYRQQAGMVEQAKQMKAAQDARKIRFAEGRTIAMTASKGLMFSGSPAAILVDTITQMEMDKAISSYNYDVEKTYLESQARATESKGMTLASQYRSAGKNAAMNGLIGGLTTFAGSYMSASASMAKPKINLGTKIKTNYGKYGTGGVPVTGYRHDGKGNFGGLI